MRVTPGSELSFSAAASIDPDGDGLTFCRRIDQEAGTYPRRVFVHRAASLTASLTSPTGAQNRQIHLVHEVQGDHPDGRLTDCRRIVLNVSAHESRRESPQGRSSPRPDRCPFPGHGQVQMGVLLTRSPVGNRAVRPSVERDRPVLLRDLRDQISVARVELHTQARLIFRVELARPEVVGLQQVGRSRVALACAFPSKRGLTPRTGNAPAPPPQQGP